MVMLFYLQKIDSGGGLLDAVTTLSMRLRNTATVIIRHKDIQCHSFIRK